MKIRMTQDIERDGVPFFKGKTYDLELDNFARALVIMGNLAVEDDVEALPDPRKPIAEISQKSENKADKKVKGKKHEVTQDIL